VVPELDGLSPARIAIFDAAVVDAFINASAEVQKSAPAG
jgi:hypothetical protein